MPSPEQSEGVRREERERTPYYQASRFSGERVAGKAYAKAQHIIFTAACKRIQKILGADEPVVLL